MCVLAALQVELSELGGGVRQFFACLLSRSDFFLAKNDFKDIKSFTFLPRTFTVSEGVIFTADLQGFSSSVDSCLLIVVFLPRNISRLKRDPLHSLLRLHCMIFYFFYSFNE